MTVKELKKLLGDVDDELELVGYQNGMEWNSLASCPSARMV